VIKYPLVMGIVNVTPDSFSDGGRWLNANAAIEHGLRLIADGADILDIGGESTRPGAARVDAEEEMRRVIPVVRALAEGGARVSIDTMRATTAEAAIAAGASMINDVSAGQADARMARIAAETGVPFVAMHWRAHSDSMHAHTAYHDVAREVCDELAVRVEALVQAGVARKRIILDPGLGFAKRIEQNWEILNRLNVIVQFGLPLLVGASRKSFLGVLLPPDASLNERDALTATVSVLASQAGAWGVRVHNVQATVRALDVWAAWQSGGMGDVAVVES